MTKPPSLHKPKSHRARPVIAALEQQIRRKRFQPGDCLPSEKAIGHEFGVSRTVVREALQALKSRGMLESRRGSGTYVASPGHTTIRESLSWYAALQKDGGRFLEMMDLRILVETFCARRLATGNSSLAAVRQQLQQMKKNATHLARFADADMAFHLAVVKASGHTLFFEVLNAVLPEIGRNFARQTHSDTTVAQKTLREHQQIFHALERRNPAQAEQRMRKHLEQSRVHLLLRFQEAIAVRPQFKVAGKAQKPRSAPRAYRRSA